MIQTEVKPVVVALKNIFSGRSTSRLIRVRVLFPDIGRTAQVTELGVLRYSGEKSIVKPEATQEELQLPEGLTIHL